MKNLIANPLTRAVIASLAVWLVSVFMAHGQNKPDDLKQRPDGKPILVEQVADVTGSGLGQEGRLHQVITYSDYRPVK